MASFPSEPLFIYQNLLFITVSYFPTLHSPFGKAFPCFKKLKVFVFLTLCCGFQSKKKAFGDVFYSIRFPDNTAVNKQSLKQQRFMATLTLSCDLKTIYYNKVISKININDLDFRNIVT